MATELSDNKRGLVAQRLRQRAPAVAQAIPRQPDGAPRVLSYAQERLWFMDSMSPAPPPTPSRSRSSSGPARRGRAPGALTRWWPGTRACGPGPDHRGRRPRVRVRPSAAVPPSGARRPRRSSPGPRPPVRPRPRSSAPPCDPRRRAGPRCWWCCTTSAPTAGPSTCSSRICCAPTRAPRAAAAACGTATTRPGSGSAWPAPRLGAGAGLLAGAARRGAAAGTADRPAPPPASSVRRRRVTSSTSTSGGTRSPRSRLPRWARPRT